MHWHDRCTSLENWGILTRVVVVFLLPSLSLSLLITLTMNADLESRIEVHLLKGDWIINWETKVLTFWSTEEIRVIDFGRPGYLLVIIAGSMKIDIHTGDENGNGNEDEDH